MSSHHDLATASTSFAPSSFEADVRAGLTATTQKTLSPKYLYDALGSTLFEAITQLPEYGLWRAERALLEQHAEEIARATEAANVIELGSGSATKTVPIVKALLRRHPVLYWSVDMSRMALEMTRRELGALRGLSVHAIEGEYLSGLEAAIHARASGSPALVLFLGSALGNFDCLESLRFLKRIRRALHPGDGLLLGIDLEKPIEQLLAAYDDALGVTAAFNLNFLVRMNRELGADFVLPQFRHQARFNANSRDVEMHIQSQCTQQIYFAGSGFSVPFQSGETIHTESSHKYVIEELASLTSGSGFRCVSQWLDAESQFVNGLYQAT